MSELQIYVRNLRRHPEGYWIAEATAPTGDGPLRYYPVHRKWGSWMYGYGMEQRDIRPEAAAELQAQVLSLERRELREWAASLSDRDILDNIKRAGGYKLTALQAEAKRRNLRKD